MLKYGGNSMPVPQERLKNIYLAKVWTERKKIKKMKEGTSK